MKITAIRSFGHRLHTDRSA